MDAENFAGIYKEIAKEIGVDVAVEVHRLFRGQQIIFPQGLYDQGYIESYVKEHYNGHNIRELARMFDYSDRRIRQIISVVRRDTTNETAYKK